MHVRDRAPAVTAGASQDGVGSTLDEWGSAEGEGCSGRSGQRSGAMLAMDGARRRNRGGGEREQGRRLLEAQARRELVPLELWARNGRERNAARRIVPGGGASRWVTRHALAAARGTRTRRVRGRHGVAPYARPTRGRSRECSHHAVFAAEHEQQQ